MIFLLPFLICIVISVFVTGYIASLKDKINLLQTKNSYLAAELSKRTKEVEHAWDKYFQYRYPNISQKSSRLEREELASL